MKALVYTGTMKIDFTDVPAPVAGNGQVIVDLSHCGICGSDMHAWHGEDSRRIPPLVLGHEAVGIARTGKFKGRRVAINPLMTCNNCEYCTSGTEHLCPGRELIGMRVPGAFAEAVSIKEINLFTLPDHLAFNQAVLAEPLAVCIHAARLGITSGKGEKSSAIILGGGAIGLLTAIVLRHYGMENIRIAETNALRRNMLADVTHAIPYDPLSSTSLERADLIIDCVGSNITRKSSCDLVKPGGSIIHVGLQDNKPGLDMRYITLQEITLNGSYCYTNSDFAEALNLLAQGHVSGHGWSEVWPLSDGGRGFEDIHKGKAAPKIILEV